MPRIHVVGLDLSLTSTGVATIRLSDDEAPEIRVEVVGAPIVREGTAYDAVLARLRNLARKVITAIRKRREEGDITIIAIEGPAYGATAGQQGHHTRAGLFWILYNILEKEATIIVIPPTTLKRYVTGKGNAPKDHVLSTMVRNFPAIGIVDNNEADALGLASMIARELGSPVEPSAQRVTPSALDGVEWPASIKQRSTK